MWKGTYTALVTPFAGGGLDEAALTALVHQQVAAGVDGVVPVGTTGESPTVTPQEHLRTIELTVQAAAGRCRVVAGTGSNATAKTVALTREAEALGADAALLVAPYYNKPSQEGLYRHFRAVADATRLPLILYSIPARCGVEIGPETVARLARDCANVVGLKEAGGQVDRISRLRQAGLPEGFSLLSGDDTLTLPFLAAGAVGVISVASNLVPAEVVHLVRSFLLGKTDAARAQHERLYPLFTDLFIEPNPVPVKAAMHWAGLLPDPEVRLPLCELSAESTVRLRRTVAALGVGATAVAGPSGS